MKKHRYLTQEEKSSLIEDYKKGMRMLTLCKKYDVAERTVTKMVRAIPPDMRQGHVRLERAVQEYVGGSAPLLSARKRHHIDVTRLSKAAYEKFPERFKQYDTELRKKVVFDALGSSVRRTAKLYGLPTSTVSRWKKRYREGALNNMQQRHHKKNVPIPNINEGIAEKEYPDLVSLG